MTKITTGKVRFSYAHVFQPYAFDSNPDKAQYSVCILIDKKDKATIHKIQKAINAAKELGKTSKWQNKVPAKLWDPLRDGDEEHPEDETFRGKAFVNAKSNQKPGIVDRELNLILDPEEFYSGCYGRASLTFFPFANSGNNGIGCALNNLQKLSDGERLGGRASAEDDFNDDFEDEDEDEEDLI